MHALNPRITVEAGKMGGKPCIRGLRFSVYDLASYLASGMTEEQILRDFPTLGRETSKPSTSSLPASRKGSRPSGKPPRISMRPSKLAIEAPLQPPPQFRRPHRVGLQHLRFRDRIGAKADLSGRLLRRHGKYMDRLDDLDNIMVGCLQT